MKLREICPRSLYLRDTIQCNDLLYSNLTHKNRSVWPDRWPTQGRSLVLPSPSDTLSFYSCQFSAEGILTGHLKGASCERCSALPGTLNRAATFPRWEDSVPLGLWIMQCHKVHGRASIHTLLLLTLPEPDKGLVCISRRNWLLLQ